jgi:hypothetical protein
VGARKAVTALLLLFVAAGLAWVGVRASRKAPAFPAAAPGASAAVSPEGRVVVHYFHGRVRCVSCNKIEALARKTLEESFPAELKDGRLAQVEIDVDRPGNGHYVQDYGLAGSAVVVVDGRPGAGGRWRNLEQVWTLLDDEAAFAVYVRGNVHDVLAGSPR